LSIALPQALAVPRVSIIMIFLEARKFIAEAIESVLMQTYHDWELILIDDGSADGTTTVAREYCAAHPERIRYFAHPGHENRGTGASRNLGLLHARGEFVAFLDADDVYLPRRLARHVEVLEAHPDVAMVQSCLEYWHSWQLAQPGAETDSREPAPPLKIGAPILPPRLLLLMLRSQGATVPGVCSLTIRRSIIASIGGFEDSFRDMYEDQVMLVKLYLHAPVILLDECLARYRQHPRSTLHQFEARGEYTPGRPHASRKHFMEWVASYLQARNVSDPMIWADIGQELWPYRHPLLWSVRKAPSRALSLARQCGERVLPRKLSRSMVRWWGERKSAAARARAVKLAASMSEQGERRLDP
jgi:glycosyltransferase involved in cell wall biosynthesis